MCYERIFWIATNTFFIQKDAFFIQLYNTNVNHFAFDRQSDRLNNNKNLLIITEKEQ